MTEHRFEADVSRVLRLVVESLYSNREIFLRELISNAADALDKLRFRALSEPHLLAEGEALAIRLIPDRDAGTLTIADDGVGMTAEELAKNLGTIAHSGSRELVERLGGAGDAKARLELIGQFGVGFYSAFLVASRVEVTSRAAGEAGAHRWSCEGGDTFVVEPAERASRGTSVVLTLKPEQRELLEPWRLRELVRQWSDFVPHPIELAVTREVGEGEERRHELAFERVNTASALWQRPAREVEREQYVELYKHLTHDWEEPLAWRHFHIEGTQMFSGIVYVPRRPPVDLFARETHHGVRLHVRRVLVLESAEELVPRWLRFVRGVVDSEDLPLNVSRELLQDSRAVRVIEKQLVVQTLDLLDELARDRPDDYALFWRAFGAVLKEGLHFAPEHRERLARLARFRSTRGDGLVTLDAYVEKMPLVQPAIYYVVGPTEAALAASPHLEALRERGWEVLLLTDPVDTFAVAGLREHGGKPLADAAASGVKLPESEDAEAHKARASASAPLLERIQRALGERVSAVRASERLVGSPACLVLPEGGVAPHVERMLRASSVELPPQRRALEVNLEHPWLQRLQARLDAGADAGELDASVLLLHEQALLAEGSPVEDPAALARKLAELVAAQG